MRLLLRMPSNWKRNKGKHFINFRFEEIIKDVLDKRFDEESDLSKLYAKVNDFMKISLISSMSVHMARVTCLNL